ncbi:conserved hypothetical protein [Crenothrix polyspora]|uniref:Uncharacterized protein n=1 Tax=Crenothrix polyspora TaxID=360316 RepID=A0A1R4HEY0_9GAMM|nr:hypothetical protein [Crenothrix polyspora]SJM94784.1 conserved hypothetical protein [Crenothrix polyspora]
MFNKATYFQSIEHEKGSESAGGLKAFKIDDSDGIAESLGFNNNMINKVDYFVEKGLCIQLIELSDLQENFKTCNAEISGAIEKINRDQSIKPKQKREQTKAIRKNAWRKIHDEFFKKWSGSIAVIERLYRKTDQPVESDPQYRMLIVCKNSTEAQILEALTLDLIVPLNGQCRIDHEVQICRTEEVNIRTIPR